MIDFFGMRFSEKGMEPDPKKIEALQNAEAPCNLSELMSFLGMTNYSARFIKWKWTEVHQGCFEELKASLQNDNVLGCFQDTATTKLIVDLPPV